MNQDRPAGSWPRGGPGGGKEGPPGIQDSFLNQLRRERTLVAVFLVSGVKLTGRIKSFDRFSLLLESDGQEQLVFKHAIATVVTSKGSGGGSPPSA